MTPLRPESFDSWAEYYWTYQHDLATDFFLPWLQQQGFVPQGKRILDVGCGIGGFLPPFAKARAERCLGLEIHSFPWPTTPRVEYRVQDIQATTSDTEAPFDLIILRDVLEHIPIEEKQHFLCSLRQFAHINTRYLVAFPPWWSAFGLHQQVFAKTFFRHLPFLSWCPWQLLKPTLAWAGESEEALREMKEVVDARLSLRDFRNLRKEIGWDVLGESYHSVRPSHELRYGWKTRNSPLPTNSVFQEFAVAGAVFYIADRDFLQDEVVGKA